MTDSASTISLTHSAPLNFAPRPAFRKSSSVLIAVALVPNMRWRWRMRATSAARDAAFGPRRRFTTACDGRGVRQTHKCYSITCCHQVLTTLSRRWSWHVICSSGSTGSSGGWCHPELPCTSLYLSWFFGAASALHSYMITELRPEPVRLTSSVSALNPQQSDDWLSRRSGLPLWRGGVARVVEIM